jgi:hypothetical protein
MHGSLEAGIFIRGQLASFRLEFIRTCIKVTGIGTEN